MRNILTSGGLLFKILETLLITLIPYTIKILWKWITTVPQKYQFLVDDIGIKPWFIRLSGIKINLHPKSYFSSKDRMFTIILTTVISSSIVWITFSTYQDVKNIPSEWAALSFIKTNERFLINNKSAKSAPGNDHWELNRNICKSKIYQDLSREIGVSEELTSLICNTIGKKGLDEYVEDKISKASQYKTVTIIFCALATIFLIYLEISVLIGNYLNKKIYIYRKKENKKLTNAFT
ncbi:DUF6216 family protein [Serratia fonticola]|uniref:Uncharacterized protein n=1 Tax=Serratia fonticola TaxID=47917 RepID=A0AAW3WS96_SERFO|nr:DUF6216 family protein [Serratia fonticola]MBC3213783.1 hypothetical protein [Serratia fonticola]NYA14734.1 hypothetical protein [Serratia fonticola]NYA34662.1 hypothetical protein [Serratia fonticola]